jgi:thiamine pyrophosphokinase
VAIIGDLDSLNGEVKQYYESQGVAVIKDEDQDTNDF